METMYIVAFDFQLATPIKTEKFFQKDDIKATTPRYRIVFVCKFSG